MLKNILGFDEVGRGSLAGPVVVACVLYNDSIHMPADVIVRDSKKMSRNQRNKTSAWVCKYLPYGIGQSESNEIDRMGIVNAILHAAQLARLDIEYRFPKQFQGESYSILVDGREHWFGDCEPIIRGDCLVSAISLASIVTKVYRDILMSNLDTFYKEWRFSSHVGYGTKFHRQLIKTNGLIQGIHRSSFCSHLL